MVSAYLFDNIAYFNPLKYFSFIFPGTTKLIIAQRVASVKDADRILVLDKGHIVEDGTYDELIEKNGFFARLVERQRLDK